MNKQTVGNYDEQLVPPEIAAAYREAAARGLPGGWTCTIDKRNRRKWTAPNNGRSCDSIPKALAISVEMNLLPPDTVILSGKRKRTLTPKAREREKKKAAKLDRQSSGSKGDNSTTKHLEQNNSGSDRNSDVDDSESDSDDDTPPEPMDPEKSLCCPRPPKMSLPTTIHWDPTDVDGRKIGWKVKIAWTEDEWVDGRIVLYDPHTHKHKIEFDPEYSRTSKSGVNYVWIWLRNEQHNIQLATRMVWAHVKGFAWWPALVMESNSPSSDTRKEGYILLEFFGTGEISTLRDTAESVRPFSPDRLDPVVAKHKKKRNAKAFSEACEEFAAIKRARNNAAKYYARKGIEMVMHNTKQQLRGTSLLGKKIQVFRNDVNYPYGETLIGKVHQYSYHQKKWLVSFEISSKTNVKYEAAWMNLHAKETAVKILDKKKIEEINELDLLPYLYGLEPLSEKVTDKMDDEDIALDKHMKNRCRGCTEYWKNTDIKVTCEVCSGSCHLSCLDPPLSFETWKRMEIDETPFICSRCKPCRGCYRNDIIYGSHLHSSPPPMLSFPAGEALDLCSMCRDAYDDKRFCPNCAHSWDDKKYGYMRKQMEHFGGRRRKGPTPVDVIEDITNELFLGSFNGDEVLPLGAKVDPNFFYPETGQWGYTEVEMLVCDSCKLWVHAGCCGVTEKDYDEISSGKHALYSKEFLCRMCCRKRCSDIIDNLKKEDTTGLFALPVSDRVTPTYHDIIKHPMDLQTMKNKAENEEYLNYAWVREMFELMVLNALTFNRMYTQEWLEAKRFYETSIGTIMKKMCKAVSPGKYDKEIQKFFEKAEEARKLEEDRVQIDETVEKKDLVAGSLASLTTTVNMPVLRDSPPDVPSCLPYRSLRLRSLDAFYCCWMDCCFTCGSSGAQDTFLHCVDCGEAFHSFCVNAPVHSMDLTAAAGWRCPNCKICEVSGDVPPDETRMLFCDMCDRAFSIDLLDPPLKKAPPGLWICGQCVDCKSCNNRSEPNGTCRIFWSRDPDKCFRCGGCEGLLKDYLPKMKCHICCGLLRKDDTDVVDCSDCGAKVHVTCDELAEDYRRIEESLIKSKSGQPESNNYLCPRCFKSPVPKTETIESERSFLFDLAVSLVMKERLGSHANYSVSELITKIAEEVDWATRDQWRDEYLAIIYDGLRVYSVAKRLFEDARFVVQQVGEGTSKHRRYAAQRALRFVTMVKRAQWDSNGINVMRIESIVAIAKLAAAFIDVASQSLGIDKKKDIPFYDRFVTLLQVPGKANVYTFPFDRVRRNKDVVVLDDKENIVKIEPGVSISFSPGNVRMFGRDSNAEEIVVKALPLCGWSNEMGSPMDVSEWRDPRECCLCHLCGDDDDDDEGLWGEGNEDESRVPRLGRLLPLYDGSWVHASCALWSSEVWESSEDSLIHSVEKARSRGALLKCFGCGLNGATVGCSKPNCSYNYHFACAKACNVAFTASQQTFCPSHRTSAVDSLTKNDGYDHMKALMIAPEKKTDKDVLEISEGELSLRVGSLVVHSLGTIESEVDGFHNENYIFPPGYFATRIFWSTKEPRKRVTYILKVDKTADMQPDFCIIPGDDLKGKITGHSAGQVYATLVERVRKINLKFFSHDDTYSKLPVIRRTRRKTFGLNGPQFFGFGLNDVRKLLESCPGVEAVVAPLSTSSPKYKFCYSCGTDPSSFVDQIIDLERKRAAARAEKSLQNSSGCARTEGLKAVTRSGGSGRITRALVRSAEEEIVDNGASSKKGEDKAKTEKNLTQFKYHQMKAIPIDQRLVARRSHIHGWGLFTKCDIPKDNPVVEYMGEIIRQPIADKREKEYEHSGEGSCYMFRLDLNRIVDATKIGSMARFMNHSCQPNAYAKIITVDTDFGPDKKIVVFAIRDISAGEEITYDYKFPVEDGSLRCTCGAPTCIGRLN